MNRFLNAIICAALFLTPAAIADTPVTPPAIPDTTFAQTAPLKIRRVTVNSSTVKRYGKIELTIDLAATFTNPFDPDDIDVSADFDGPDGEAVHANAFFDQEYSQKPDGLVVAGLPIWKVRFAPTASGVWRYRVTARDRSGTVQSAPGSVTVTPSTDPGFVLVSSRNPYAFAFRGEMPFFPIGEDICWDDSSHSYSDWFRKLHAAGGNWTRIWMCSWSNGIEWSSTATTHNSPGYHGLGVYNLLNAWKLDHTLDMADANQIYVMLCLGTFGEFTSGGYFSEGQWVDNPYNAANGGPCAKAEDFFTSPDAQKYYQRRLRYLAARYSWRTGLQAWEFWNEYNAPAPWVATMAQYLKGSGPYNGKPADPNHHLITTTYGNADVWKIPEVDWTQSHLYGTGDIPDLGPPIAADAAQNMAYGKPHLMAEFGIDYRKADTDYDQAGKGINLHNGIWSSAAGGGAGSAMIWWWDSYVDPKNLYHEFTPLAKVASKVEWTAAPSKLLTFDPIMQKVLAENFVDLTLPGRTQWGKAATTEFHIDPQGPGFPDSYPSFLYSPGKQELRTTPTFFVRYSHPGQFIVHVNQVSNSATLQISVDGAVVQTYKLDAAPPANGATPDYKSTEFNEQWKIYQATFDKDYAVDIPAGNHHIDIAVTDGDWLSVTNYRLTNYRSNRYANASANGVVIGREALIWVHNLDHNWKNAYDKLPDTTINSPRTTVHGLIPGRYLVTWFDTKTGKALIVNKVQSTASGAPLAGPDMTMDYAVLLQKLPGK